VRKRIFINTLRPAAHPSNEGEKMLRIAARREFEEDEGNV